MTKISNCQDIIITQDVISGVIIHIVRVTDGVIGWLSDIHISSIIWSEVECISIKVKIFSDFFLTHKCTYSFFKSTVLVTAACLVFT